MKQASKHEIIVEPIWNNEVSEPSTPLTWADLGNNPGWYYNVVVFGPYVPDTWADLGNNPRITIRDCNN
jgi:hypothetical protein